MHRASGSAPQLYSCNPPHAFLRPSRDERVQLCLPAARDRELRARVVRVAGADVRAVVGDVPVGVLQSPVAQRRRVRDTFYRRRTRSAKRQAVAQARRCEEPVAAVLDLAQGLRLLELLLRVADLLIPHPHELAPLTAPTVSVAAADAGREHRRLVHHRRRRGGGGGDMKEGAAGRGAGTLLEGTAAARGTTAPALGARARKLENISCRRGSRQIQPKKKTCERRILYCHLFISAPGK